jgi:hypothetical protein
MGKFRRAEAPQQTGREKLRALARESNWSQNQMIYATSRMLIADKPNRKAELEADLAGLEISAGEKSAVDSALAAAGVTG